MVDTKDQSNAIVYAMLFVDSVDIQRKLLGWLLKKVMGRNALEILMPSIDSVNIYSIWWYSWKAHSLSFPKLFADWKSVEY